MQNVWDTDPLEWSAVSSAARAANEVVHLGRVFPLLTVKGSELPLDKQKVKGRLVFGGNSVTTSDWNQEAQFQDLGSAPAAMTAYRVAVALGHSNGNIIQQADAETAYIQSELTGHATYVIIPEELRSPAEKLMHLPVHRLRKALYGHPDSGGCWEAHLERALLSCQFKPVDDWASVFIHGPTNCMLVVYVDDFLLAGPPALLPGVWQSIMKVVRLGAHGPLEHFLGCTHIVKPAPVADDPSRIEIAFNMSGYLAQSVESYQTLAKSNAKFPRVDTPYIYDEAFSEIPGVNASTAQRILPKLLYAARLARPDIMHAINVLSRYLTKWTQSHDRALHRLIAYVNSTTSKMLRGYVGAGSFYLRLFCDADYAGCIETARSTSGMWLCLSSAAWAFPLEWSSKRQSCVSHSTPEAEFVSLSSGLRVGALPVCCLLESYTNQEIDIIVEEDNTATIQILNKGRSPVLRHLSKTHRINLGATCEICKLSQITVRHCDTENMLADSFTKALKQPAFVSALEALCVF